jgi:hypothetical protein
VDKSSKNYLAASVSALSFAILFVLVAIAVRRVAPEMAADPPKIAVELIRPLPP